jgi:hypothetical protein
LLPGELEVRQSCGDEHSDADAGREEEELTNAVKFWQMPPYEWQSQTSLRKSYMSSISPLTPFCTTDKTTGQPFHDNLNLKEKRKEKKRIQARANLCAVQSTSK